MTGLAAEVIKNVVLSGIKSLTILDSEDAQRENCIANFFVPKDKFGEKVRS
jgi:molybdopterin/thiamine biosynthesis adenylyltransferase